MDAEDNHEPSPLSESWLTDAMLMEEYQQLLKNDPEVKAEALLAAQEMKEVPLDELDATAGRPTGEQGMVQRRAPLNPFASHKLGKYRLMGGKKKIADPALRNNPLRGRLIITLTTSFVLLFVFLQSLVFNYLATGRWMDPANKMKGPTGVILNNLGGLNTNAIRGGQIIRLFWSMWMHSGWFHLLLNVLSQIQFLYMFEPDWGFWRTAFLFWISGISGNLLSSIVDPCSVTVGSSGALYGLMGAMLIYCMEYWKSIPRPGCIFIFTTIVLMISFLTGFTGATDNWAHLGGLLGGVFFATATVPSLTILDDVCSFGQKKEGRLVGADGRVKKKQIKHFQQPKGKQGCKCGVRENCIRLVSFLLLSTFCTVTSYLLFVGYQFKPLGHITFSGAASCCCCFVKEPRIRKNWHCRMCALPPPPDAVGNRSEDFGDYCGAAGSASARKLLGRDLFATLNDKI